jgi:hypothetical protein
MITEKKTYEVIYCKNRHSTKTVNFSESPTTFCMPHLTFHYGVISEGEEVFWLLCQSCPPASSQHLIRSDGQLDCLLGARRGENRRVPNLANMAVGVTLLILNPESVSR